MEAGAGVAADITAAAAAGAVENTTTRRAAAAAVDVEAAAAADVEAAAAAVEAEAPVVSNVKDVASHSGRTHSGTRRPIFAFNACTIGRSPPGAPVLLLLHVHPHTWMDKKIRGRAARIHPPRPATRIVCGATRGLPGAATSALSKRLTLAISDLLVTELYAMRTLNSKSAVGWALRLWT